MLLITTDSSIRKRGLTMDKIIIEGGNKLIGKLI